MGLQRAAIRSVAGRIIFARINLINNAHLLVSYYRLTSVLSTNAAMSAAVVLSSRLRDDISVFALMLFSIQIFALFPILRTRLLVSTEFASTHALINLSTAIAQYGTNLVDNFDCGRVYIP